jgi:putative transcriptional regulator
MFSDNLKMLRKQKGMSQEQLAQQLDVVRQTVSKWEKGLSLPDAELLTKIAEFFEVPVGRLLGEKIEEEKTENEIASQLEIMNAQIANRSKRRRKVWIVTLTSLAALALLAAVLVTALLKI